MRFPSPLLKKIVLPIIGLAFIAGLLGYHFFVNVKCPAYPWWHEFGNDADGTYVAQTIALINDGSLHYIHHPGGTVYAIHGLAYRFLAAVNVQYSHLLQLHFMPDMQAVFTLLNIATSASRILTFLLAILFLLVFYAALFQLTKNRTIAFFFSFFFLTSPAILQHLFMIRPELLNLLFCGAAFSLGLMIAKRREDPIGPNIFTCALVGLCLGLALFAKIQVLPLVIAVVTYQCYVEFFRAAPPALLRKLSLDTLNLALVNIFIFPWWSVRRPTFLTKSYLAGMPSFSDYARVYGKAPESFILLFALTLGGLMLVSWTFFLARKTFMSHWQKILFMINSVILGAIVSIYAIFIPVSVSWKGYIANTNHLFYSLLTNILGGGFLMHRVSDWDTPRNIFLLHNAQSPILGANVLFFVAAAAAFSVWKIFVSPSKEKKIYAAVLVFLALGLAMDIMASKRMLSNRIYTYYALYSLCCHCLGLAVLAAAQWNKTGWRWVNFKTLFIVLMSIQVLLRVGYVVSYPKASGKSDQTAQQELRNTASHATPFWDIVVRQNK